MLRSDSLRLGFVVWRPESLDQLSWVNPQPRRQLEQVVQAQVAPAPLDLPEECPMDAGLMRQSFLAETQSFAAGADTFAEYLGGGGEWFDHSAANDIRPDCLCTEQLCPMCLRPGTVRPYVCARRLDLLARRTFADPWVYPGQCDRPRDG